MMNYIQRNRITISLLLVFTGINFLLSFTNTCSAQSEKPSEIYKSFIKQADLAFTAQDYEDALLLYEKASETKPEYNYASDQIIEIKKILEASPELKAQFAEKNKTTSTSYKILLAQANRAYDALDYAGALLLYEKAYQTKPDYIYATDKIDEINSLLNAIPDTKARLFTDILIKADSLYEQKIYQQAKAEYQKALLLEPSAQLPKDRLDIISHNYIDPDDMANFNIALANGDKAVEISDFDHAIIYYEAALAIHPNFQFVKTKISETKTQHADYKLRIAQSETYVASADKLIPSEETNTSTNTKEIVEPAPETSSEYNKALEVADNLYAKKVFDQAIEAYESAAILNPGDTYPELQIDKIRKYMSDHAFLDLCSQSLIISKGEEKKFAFSAIDPSLRKNNYILIKARFKGTSAPKVYLSYGKDNLKNGGIVLQNFDKTTISDFLINISIQDKWFREENNWLSISVETGEVEITKVQIAAGE